MFPCSRNDITFSSITICNATRKLLLVSAVIASAFVALWLVRSSLKFESIWRRPSYPAVEMCSWYLPEVETKATRVMLTIFPCSLLIGHGKDGD